MATPSPGQPWRYLGVALAVVIVLYAAMFATSNTTPQLGLDLRGGTEVTLTPKATPGNKVKINKSTLQTAENIIRNRVSGLGVSEPSVSLQGNNIVIDVPGHGRNQILQLVGKTALLRFRQVLAEDSGAPLPVTTSAPTTTPIPLPTGTAPAAKKTTSPRSHASAKPTSGTHGRALSSALTAAAKKTAKPKPHATPATSPTPAATLPAAPPLTATTALTSLQQAEAAFAAYQCTHNAPKPIDDANNYLIACDTANTTKFLLAPAKVNGTDLHSAAANLPTQGLGDWEVDLTFKSHGASVWGDVTTASTKLPDCPGGSPASGGCNAVAIVLDGQVQSAPKIIQPILGGDASITGNFSQKQASDLANVLKYGALPITFQPSNVVSISASLGNDQLNAGLLAGAIGLVLVVLYSLIYYRGLGLVTIASLALAGVVTYATVVLLGQTISYTLTLAGIAGLIVAIGITADSFVVYFERIRDEVREGRTLRSSVERGWARAIRTILAADFVSLLAAVVLYLLSIGSVRGFAFTLGLSTVIDLFIVVFFTKPVITLLVRTRAFGSGKPWTGLSPDRLGARPVAAPERRDRAHRRPRTGEA